MRPYHINAEGVANGKTWIDLDHIQMISDVVVDNDTEFGTATASFSVVLAFRENSISFAVYGKHESSRVNEFGLRESKNFPVSEKDVALIKQVHYDLVVAWHGLTPHQHSSTNSRGPR